MPMGATQRNSTISNGKAFVLSSSATNLYRMPQPTNVQMSSPPRGIRNLAVRKSNSEKNPIPMTVTSFHNPNDKLHATPSRKQMHVTMVAAYLRLSLNVSCI